jgi:HemY protein
MIAVPAQPAEPPAEDKPVEADSAPQDVETNVLPLNRGAAAAAAESAATDPQRVPPVFRRREGLDRAASAAPAIPPVIPIMRAPDDPGIDDEPPADEEQAARPQTQPDGWRGLLSRWVG